MFTLCYTTLGEPLSTNPTSRWAIELSGHYLFPNQTTHACIATESSKHLKTQSSTITVTIMILHCIVKQHIEIAPAAWLMKGSLLPENHRITWRKIRFANLIISRGFQRSWRQAVRMRLRESNVHHITLVVRSQCDVLRRSFLAQLGD